jgi:hypothetical protein
VTEWGREVLRIRTNKLGQGRSSARRVEEGGRRNRLNPTNSNVDEGRRSSKKVENVEMGLEKSKELVEGWRRSQKVKGEM